jgi:hypothetical protein
MYLVVDMHQSFEKIGEIKEEITLQVSVRGGGLCLYLPKVFCETYDVIAGHRLKIRIGDHFRPKPSENASDECAVPPKCAFNKPRRHNNSRSKGKRPGEPDDIPDLG